MTNKVIKNVDQDGLDPKSSAIYKNNREKQRTASGGVGNKPLSEPIPEFIPSGNDHVIKGTNNTYIVLGRDRPGNRLSGYSAHTQAGAIDIVVGRMGGKPKRKKFVDPDFEKDSARIYISQKTDIDKNFNLAKGTIGDKIADSGIAIKADGVRIIARQGIKLITEQNDVAKYGINIIANNDDSDLQPMVKGDNLVAALNDVVKNIEELSGIVSTILSAQMDFNIATASHIHEISPFFGLMVPPSQSLLGEGIDVMMKHLTDGILKGLASIKSNFIATKTTYLNPNGEKYINSSYNHLN